MNKATKVYELLFERFGPQHWWPAESPFEVIVGAILMPQTSWTNVERAIGNLKRADMLAPSKIAYAHIDELTELLRPAGLYRTKPRRLKEFCHYIMTRSGGDVDAFLHGDTDSLREDLLSQQGIGPETADSILLYAANAARFVVDAYTVRIATRVGLMHGDDYVTVQRFFQESLRHDVRLFQEYHALIVALGKGTCRPRPRCGECPLERVCGYSMKQKLSRSRGSRQR